jgi:hypothetical protein
VFQHLTLKRSPNEIYKAFETITVSNFISSAATPLLLQIVQIVIKDHISFPESKRLLKDLLISNPVITSAIIEHYLQNDRLDRGVDYKNATAKSQDFQRRGLVAVDAISLEATTLTFPRDLKVPVDDSRRTLSMVDENGNRKLVKYDPKDAKWKMNGMSSVHTVTEKPHASSDFERMKFLEKVMDKKVVEVGFFQLDQGGGDIIASYLMGDSYLEQRVPPVIGAFRAERKERSKQRTVPY